jgi:putative oxidoreductase
VNTDLALFILRVAAGAMLLTHGIPKLLHFTATVKWIRAQRIPLPYVSTVGVTGAETVGAILLILGVSTQWVALLLAGVMCVALLTHLRARDSFKQFEDAALYLVIFLTLAIAGGGAWTLLS